MFFVLSFGFILFLKLQKRHKRGLDDLLLSLCLRNRLNLKSLLPQKFWSCVHSFIHANGVSRQIY